jgi:hypothetical protein
MSKIKSIRITLPVEATYYDSLTTTIFEDNGDFRIEQSNLIIIADKSIVKDIEYEPEKPKILKRPDGSVISGLEKGDKIIFINPLDFEIEKGEYTKEAEDILKRGLIFLLEDIESSEKKAKMLTKQLEIQYEIDRLNTEEGWVADWEDSRQAKFYLHFNYSCSTVEIRNCYFYQSAGQHMSRKTAETILKKFTQEELRQYLGIII